MLGGLALGFVASVGAVYLVTGDPGMTAVFGFGVMLMLAGVFAFDGWRSAPGEIEVTAPDWSVTVAAIEGEAQGAGSAVTVHG